MRATTRTRECNRGCGASVVLARRVDTNRWVPYEAGPVDGPARAGCHVLVNDQAWKPTALAEHFQVQFELPSLEKARELVEDYPHHRPHLHLTTDDTRTQGDTHP
ncbi:hypothetical protein [Pimelobacter simplex]|uniref:hypothetical protein n=1 Tax=Nocardioides simplex TaxID=2045 RepID=UPI0021503FA8|nr:hypothetical protein [Pimelobacter simplex]UUW88358.1 hypothetical protein M0M43_21800 [Pimelobacter simplex]UUW97862.1 hypothetical protein M0M48_10445 [Pimelobacter simplex]